MIYKVIVFMLEVDYGTYCRFYINMMLAKLKEIIILEVSNGIFLLDNEMVLLYTNSIIVG